MEDKRQEYIKYFAHMQEEDKKNPSWRNGLGRYLLVDS